MMICHKNVVKAGFPQPDPSKGVITEFTRIYLDTPMKLFNFHATYGSMTKAKNNIPLPINVFTHVIRAHIGAFWFYY